MRWNSKALFHFFFAGVSQTGFTAVFTDGLPRLPVISSRASLSYGNCDFTMTGRRKRRGPYPGSLRNSYRMDP